MVKKDIIIIGAGPAGLVAAINLNREGFNVVVREKEDSVGGPPGWHPSVHTTPVGSDLFKYIGIDLSEAFVDSTDVLEIYMNGKEVGDFLADDSPYGDLSIPPFCRDETYRQAVGALKLNLNFILNTPFYSCLERIKLTVNSARSFYHLRKLNITLLSLWHDASWEYSPVPRC